MTRPGLVAWLEARRPAPPDALAAHLVAVATELAPEPAAPLAAGLTLPDALALLGRRLLARVTARPGGGRELALDLLAADAFVTYAFEAQAEADVAGLAELARRVATGAA